MDLQLGGLRALVTGSSSGIGAGIATVLAAEGAIVIVHGRDKARTNTVAEQLPLVVPRLTSSSAISRRVTAAMPSPRR